MTLILDLTPEQESILREEAIRNGTDPETYALIRLFGEDAAPQSLADRLREVGALGAIEGKPRPDGRNRSEIEPASDNQAYLWSSMNPAELVIYWRDTGILTGYGDVADDPRDQSKD